MLYHFLLYHKTLEVIESAKEYYNKGEKSFLKVFAIVLLLPIIIIDKIFLAKYLKLGCLDK